MLKNPYGSRVFGHLFDLVRLVTRCALRPNDWTARISMRLIRPLHRADIKKAEPDWVRLFYVWDIFIFLRRRE